MRNLPPNYQNIGEGHASELKKTPVASEEICMEAINTTNVLLIDDEGDILEILTYILQKEGFTVSQARDGMEALELIRSRKFSGVVSDLCMPKIDGIALLKIVRAQNNFIPFIFLSGHADVRHKLEMLNFGAYELIDKPHLNRVPDALKNLLRVAGTFQDLEKSNPVGKEFMEIIHDSGKKNL